MNLKFTHFQKILNTSKRRLTFLAVLLFALVHSVAAQTPQFYNGNTGASNNSFPLNSATSNKVQWIYGPGTLNSAGASEPGICR